MGNIHPANISCTIQLLDDLEPGDTLHGFVRLTVHADVLTQFEGINIIIAGVEYAITSGPTSQVIPTRRVFNLVYSIANFEDGGRVEKGDYIYPFEVVLPNDDVNTRKPTNMPKMSSNRGHGRIGSDTSMSSSYSFGGVPGMIRLDSTATSQSIPETELPVISTAIPDLAGSSMKVMYKVRASLRRKAKVLLTVDTDIKCDAVCVEL